MEHILCRNCGNTDVYANTVNTKVVHYDCLECNYKWAAPPVHSGNMLFNIVAGLIGLSLIIFGLSDSLAHVSVMGQSPSILSFTGIAIVALFAYRSIHAYRLIRK